MDNIPIKWVPAVFFIVMSVIGIIGIIDAMAK